MHITLPIRAAEQLLMSKSFWAWFCSIQLEFNRPGCIVNTLVSAWDTGWSHSGSSSTARPHLWGFSLTVCFNCGRAIHSSCFLTALAIGTRGEILTKVPLALPLSFGPVNSLVPSRDLSKPVELSSLSSVSSGYSSALTEWEDREDDELDLDLSRTLRCFLFQW